MKTARTIAALVGVLAVLLLGASPAAAHGGEGRAEITSITGSGGDVTVVVRLTYVEDGHGVPDATVTVVVGDGTPVPMEPGDEEGVYQATVPAEEGATIRVTSVEPATSVEGTVPAAPADESATTEAGSSTTAAETTTTDASSPAEDDAPLDDEDVPEPNALDEEPEDGNGNLIVIAVVALVAVAAVVAAVVLRRKPPTTGDEAGS